MQSLLNALYHPRAGFFILRWSVAGLMLFHGVAKLMKGVSGIEGMVTSAGLPGFVAYGVFIGELLAPLLVLIGVLVGPAALVMAINMVFAIALAHTGELLALGKSGGWALELQGLFLFGSLAIALMAAPRTR
ncbi:MAG: DoxX family protein [Methylibium sp.]|uniref:DoxX family protein n=1 Tax=Methylibium sp. TaxID=2067992 RepID=UPI001821A033|nr:DoxX family protein [Methylibium sp.]MBA3590548.1 DoxX family protein [Methylibium sp.]MBA3624878.1 DoxX family protein [Methylibium sp.]